MSAASGGRSAMARTGFWSRQSTRPERIVQVLKDPGLRQRIGAGARESVRQNFLMSRLLEDWLDVLAKRR